MKDIKMVISDSGVYPTDKPGMYFARNDMHEYYKEVANILVKPNSDILEIGFGMGICSKEIQKLKPKSHTIIEINQDIYNHGLEWSSNIDNVELILGNWIDIIPTLTKTFDGIFIDTIEDGNIWDFERYASMISKKDTILSMVHYERVKNTNLYSKKINGTILNWSVYDSKRFTTNVDKSKLI